MTATHRQSPARRAARLGAPFPLEAYDPPDDRDEPAAPERDPRDELAERVVDLYGAARNAFLEAARLDALAARARLKRRRSLAAIWFDRRARYWTRIGRGLVAAGDRLLERAR